MTASRQQRRRFDRQLKKLIQDRGDNCSICGIEFQHNDRTFGGHDEHGNIALVGKCCVERMRAIHTAGIFSRRSYDFIRGDKRSTGEGASIERIAHGLDALQRAIAVTDREVEDASRRAGVDVSHAPVHVLGHTWKGDDQQWFEQNPDRSHRARLPFIGEFEPEQIGKVPDGHEPVVLIRQVEPGKRIRVGFFIRKHMLPVPDAEPVAHALFDIAAQAVPVPPNGTALGALVGRYMTEGTS